MIKITIFHQILLLQFIDTQKWAIEPKSTHENDYIHIAQNCLAMNCRILFWFQNDKNHHFSPDYTLAIHRYAKMGNRTEEHT